MMTRLLFVTILAACGAPKTPTQAPQPITQGVRGTVERDFMPPLPEGYRGTVTPLAARVFIFAGKIQSDTPVDETHPSLRAIVKSDANGHFTAALDPGVYTVVAELDGKLYFNSFDGDGYWNTLTVERGTFVDYKIADTSRATY
jgi:hypothetical protein